MARVTGPAVTSAGCCSWRSSRAPALLADIGVVIVDD
jgi:hypothetical protein